MMTELSQRALCLLFLYAMAVGAAGGALWDLFRIRRVSMASENLLRARLGMAPRGDIVCDADGVPRSSAHSDAHARTRRRLKIKYVPLPSASDCLIFFEDVLFALLAAAAFITLIYQCNGGRFRLLALAGGLCGFALWYNTAGRLIMRASAAIVLAIRAALRAIARTVISVARFIWKYTGSPLCRVIARQTRKLAARVRTALSHRRLIRTDLRLRRRFMAETYLKHQKHE